MTLDLREINISIEVTSLLFSVVLLIGMLVTGMHKTKLTRILAMMLVANCGTLLFDAVAWILGGQKGPAVHPLMVVVNLAGFVMSYIQLVLSAYYIVTYVSMRRPGTGGLFLKLFGLATSIFIVLLIISQFNGIIYQINDENNFEVGPLYAVGFLWSIALLVLLIVFVLYHRKSFAGRDFVVILLYPLSTLLANVVEMVIIDLMVAYVMTAIVLGLIFVTVQYQQEKQAAERENEAKISVMLSQIQPHFLYNTLATIEGLCKLGEMEQSEQALHVFSKYLRFNMDTLAVNKPITFEKELEHIKMFLWISGLRFKERLAVKYDIRTTGFHLPALSLQVVVENAVWHGITKRDAGGTVLIRTEETDKYWRITVEDDGVGFDQNERVPNDNSHIGIDNARYRLWTMSRGTLELASTPGVGTTATIAIPKEGSHA